MLLTLALGPVAYGVDSEPIDHWPTVEESGPLRVQVEFWMRIYGELDSDQGLLHDAKYPSVVYEQVNLRRKVRRRVTAAAETKWRSRLLALHQKWSRPGGVKEGDLSEDEKFLVKLFRDVPEQDKFLDAAHRRRIRFQLGQKNEFLSGYKISGRYLPEMEAVFRKEGLPIQLTRLPFVESSFNVKARSKVGASGIWQFMRSTGGLYLRIDEAVDERNDPIRAAEAAARLLRTNFEALGSWPLAVTAYNHGRKGMMRAVRKVGSLVLDDLISSYQRRSFGFASSNFFTCLLAAIEVEKRATQYFGEVRRQEPIPSFEFRLPRFTDLPEVISFFHVDGTKARNLNPGLAEAVWGGRLLAPMGYRLRLPRSGENTEESDLRVFSASYEKFPPLYQMDEQKKERRRVKKYGMRRRS